MLLLSGLAECCKVNYKFESPSLYEPIGFRADDKVIVYNSCHLHSTHCIISLFTYDLS